MKGDWFDVCSCAIACPCTFAQPPDDDHCEGVLAHHIREGAFGDLRLDDLSVISVLSFDGDFWAGKAEAVSGLFIDERADPRQREALQLVFSGQAGGYPGTMAALMAGTDRGTRFVPIHFEVAEDLAYWRVEIPGKVVARAEALTGPTTPAGARVQLHNPPGSETGPGQIATWGAAVENRVDAYGFQWSWAGKSSKHIPFDFAGPS
jgi:hypothetical protein